MNKQTILITAICGDIGCSAVHSLHAAGHQIIGCDIDKYSPIEHLVDTTYEVPPASDTDNYIKSIKSIIAEQNVKFLLPISEPEIKVISQRRNELEIEGVKLLINNNFIIDNFLDKLKTAKYLQNIGIKTPKTMLLEDYDNSFGFPLIVKHKTGSGSKLLWTVNDTYDLEYVRRKNKKNLIAQEHIGSNLEEYTTGVFSDGNNISVITFRRLLGFGGLSKEAILVDEPLLVNMAIKIAHATNLIGSINIQSRRSKTSIDLIPFEINPRISSTLLFRKVFGFDDASWWLQTLSGEKYIYKKEYKSGRAIRCLSEYYFDMKRV